MTTGRFWGQIVPAFTIVGALWVTIAFRPVNSGVEARAVPASTLRDAPVSVAKVGARETLGTRRFGADGRVRFDLQPGRYVVMARTSGGVTRRQVFVRDERYVSVRIVDRARRS